jgi:hypothetical protein
MLEAVFETRTHRSLRSVLFLFSKIAVYLYTAAKQVTPRLPLSSLYFIIPYNFVGQKFEQVSSPCDISTRQLTHMIATSCELKAQLVPSSGHVSVLGKFWFWFCFLT